MDTTVSGNSLCVAHQPVKPMKQENKKLQKNVRPSPITSLELTRISWKYDAAVSILSVFIAICVMRRPQPLDSQPHSLVLITIALSAQVAVFTVVGT
jgi:hypothetical protein